MYIGRLPANKQKTANWTISYDYIEHHTQIRGFCASHRANHLNWSITSVHWNGVSKYTYESHLRENAEEWQTSAFRRHCNALLQASLSPFPETIFMNSICSTVTENTAAASLCFCDWLINVYSVIYVHIWCGQLMPVPSLRGPSNIPNWNVCVRDNSAHSRRSHKVPAGKHRDIACGIAVCIICARICIYMHSGTRHYRQGARFNFHFNSVAAKWRRQRIHLACKPQMSEVL